MVKQFHGQTCGLCSNAPSSRAGEHVWPTWFRKWNSPGEDGPYTWLINGVLVRTRDGHPRSHSSAGAVKVPACHGCNAALNQRFEAPAKPLVRALLATDRNVVFEGAEATVLALWFVKTWLLLAHPAARHSEPAVSPQPWRRRRDDLYTWMVTDQPPPGGLSLWIARGGGPPDGQPARLIPLPTVFADGREIEFSVKSVRIRSFSISLVYHPGWMIEHPLEIERRALRLWPQEPGERVDFSILPPIDLRQTRWLKGPRLWFFPGAFDRGPLPPLSADSDFLDLAPGLVEAVSG